MELLCRTRLYCKAYQNQSTVKSSSYQNHWTVEYRSNGLDYTPSIMYVPFFTVGTREPHRHLWPKQVYTPGCFAIVKIAQNEEDPGSNTSTTYFSAVPSFPRPLSFPILDTSQKCNPQRVTRVQHHYRVTTMWHGHFPAGSNAAMWGRDAGNSWWKAEWGHLAVLVVYKDHFPRITIIDTLSWCNLHETSSDNKGRLCIVWIICKKFQTLRSSPMTRNGIRWSQCTQVNSFWDPYKVCKNSINTFHLRTLCVSANQKPGQPSLFSERPEKQ